MAKIIVAHIAMLVHHTPNIFTIDKGCITIELYNLNQVNREDHLQG